MELTITLPEAWKEFIEAEVAAGSHGTPANYIQTLLLEVKRRKAQEKVDALLDEGLNSGKATPWTAQDVTDVRQELARRRAQRNGGSP